jgi:hypothetical protein
MYRSSSFGSSEDDVTEAITRMLRAHRAIMAELHRLLAATLGSGQARLATRPVEVWAPEVTTHAR